MNISGTSGNDLLVGTIFNDTIDGLAGSDRIEGSDGNDLLNGGDGDDSSIRNLRDSSGNIRVAQVAGLFGGAGNDTLNGGAGNDFLSPGAGLYTVDGGTEFDVLGFSLATATTALVVTYTNSAGTTANGNTIRNIEFVAIDSGSANDVINVTATSGGRFNTDGSLISTGAGNDTINAGSGRDRLLGGDGDDVIDGGAGNDSSIVNYTTSEGRLVAAQVAGLFGGAGNDTLNGGAGDDFLSPGAGLYTVDGGTEFDTLGFNLATATTAVVVTYTNSAGTTANGNTIRNVEFVAIDSGSANDVINVTATSGGRFNNDGSLISTGAGNDTINAGSGRDRLLGGDGDDVIDGGAGDDSGTVNYTNSEGRLVAAQTSGLAGGAGNDTLNGGAGNDLLFGGAGNDSLIGGLGGDRLLFDLNTAFNSTIGVDTVSGFLSGTDKIVLDKTTFTALSSVAGNGFSVSGEFATVTTDAAAATSTAFIVYNSSNGRLFYNQNGSATGLGTGTQFATLAANPSLNALDFVVQT